MKMLEDERRITRASFTNGERVWVLEGVLLKVYSKERLMQPGVAAPFMITEKSWKLFAEGIPIEISREYEGVAFEGDGYAGRCRLDEMEIGASAVGVFTGIGELILPNT